MTTEASSVARGCEVVELRQYTLHPGQRDVLIELFDREFVETQEAVGIQVIGQFRQDAEPDRYVWLRGFADMIARRRALTAFYEESETWAANSEAARATMASTINTLLLKPIGLDSGFDLTGHHRPGIDAHELPSSRIVATICYANAPFGAEFAGFFEENVSPVLAQLGASPIAAFQSEHAENTFPRLPVREGENVFVWFSRFANDAELAQHARRLEQPGRWRDELLPELRTRLSEPLEQLTLSPTARSRLR
ncbi:MAG: NIPSNAP family protein [Acidimicrobiales bacterium]